MIIISSSEKILQLAERKKLLRTQDLEAANIPTAYISQLIK